MQPSSNGTFLLVVIVLTAVAAGAYFFLLQEDDKEGGSSQGISLVIQQPGQLPPQQPAQQQTRPAQQQPAGQQPQNAPGDQVLTVNMQFTQTLVRTEGRCPSNAPAPGFDVSPRAPTKVTINKTKRTIQFENSDGSKSDVNSYDAATGLAVITYQSAPDNRGGVIKVTETALDGESTFFPYRGRQGAEQYNDCKFVLKTTAKVV